MKRFSEQPGPMPEQQELPKEGPLLPEQQWHREIETAGFHDAEAFMVQLYAQSMEPIGKGFLPPPEIENEYLQRALESRKMSQEDQMTYLRQFRLSRMLGYPRTPES